MSEVLLSGLHRALGIVLLQGPRGALFLMSEVPLCMYIEVQVPVHVQNPLGVRTLNYGTQTHAIGDVLVFIRFKIRTKLGWSSVLIYMCTG